MKRSLLDEIVAAHDARIIREEGLDSQKPLIIKTYKGTAAQAAAAFQINSALFAAHGYFPTSQSSALGGGAKLSLVFSCLILSVLINIVFGLIGVLVFVFLAVALVLIVRPGTLTVTYELRAVPAIVDKALPVEEKTCPKCAEQVKAAALVCRFCRHEFEPA